MAGRRNVDEAPASRTITQRGGFLGPLSLGFDPQEPDPRGDRDRPGTAAQQAASLARIRADREANPLPYDLDDDPFTPEGDR